MMKEPVANQCLVNTARLRIRDIERMISTVFIQALSHPPSAGFSQPKLIPVVLKLKEAYGTWQNCLVHFPKAIRFTLGSKIDDVFLVAIEYCFLASYSRMEEKLILVDRCISRVDLLKLLIGLSWGTRALDAKKYEAISIQLFEIGRTLGGWRRQLANKTPESGSREKKE
jgi:hypothetical protein